MRTLFSLLLLALTLALGGAAPLAASELLRTFDWRRDRLAGEVTTAAGDELRLAVEAPEGATLPLLLIDAPAVTTARYALTGRLRHAGVEAPPTSRCGPTFADGSRFFSRTVAPEGPLAAISGSSGWRPFVLPSTSSAPEPHRPASK